MSPAIEKADWHDILPVLKETFNIWSPGLTRADYRHYIWSQMCHPWARSNFSYMVVRNHAGMVAASCKLYKVCLKARYKTYKFAGLGAVYSMLGLRGQGFGKKLMESMVEYAEADDYDGMILFSDIGPQYYQQFGFEELGGADFWMELPFVASEKVSEHCKQLEDRSNIAFTSRKIDLDDLSDLERNHRRWLPLQPFGFERSPQYWSYKLMRERYLNNHSMLSWPALEVLYLHIDGVMRGHAITEYGGRVLRILEIVGNFECRDLLWQGVILHAMRLGAGRVRGWESQIRDFTPRFSLSRYKEPGALTHALLDEKFTGVLHYVDRQWGRPMILPFDEEMESWFRIHPCPLLELDHL